MFMEACVCANVREYALKQNSIKALMHTQVCLENKQQTLLTYA